MNGLWTEIALEIVKVLPDHLQRAVWRGGRPERLELIDALPRTQVGKVSKVTLRADIGAKLNTRPPRAALPSRRDRKDRARRHDWCYEVHRAFPGSQLPRAVPSTSGSRNGVTVAMASSSVRAIARRERRASAA